MITMRIRNNAAELPRLATRLGSLARQNRLSKDEESSLKLVLEELVTNVISYAHDDDADHEICVRVAIAEREIRVEVEDDGRPFDPLGAPPVDVAAPLDDRPIGGAGIHLVRSFADDVDYRRRAGRNNVVVVLKRTGQQQLP
ncbi:MAG: ATP-binding protein [Planctomycetota bacterium]|jgi:anti-sigma regulatory factor (Ser/Thr protein kinase)